MAHRVISSCRTYVTRRAAAGREAAITEEPSAESPGHDAGAGPPEPADADGWLPSQVIALAVVATAGFDGVSHLLGADPGAAPGGQGHR